MMTEPAGPSVARRVASGAGMMILLRLGERLVGLVTFSICARLLAPADFGLVALATSVVALVELFGHAGVDLALIQKRDADRRDYDTAWTLSVLIGTAAAAILCAIASPVAGFFKEPRVEFILYCLAGASFIAGFENIGTVQFRKSLDFRREFAYRLSIRVVAAAVVIAAALIWRDYSALVLGFLAGKIGLVGLSYLLHRYRPRFTLSGFASIAAFSKWVLVHNIVSGLGEQAATFIIARLLNVGVLAQFSAAKEISEVATTEIQAPIRRALFPGFSALSGDPGAIRRMYLDATGLMVMLGLPIPVGLALVAPDVVRVLLGEQWLTAAPLIPILALAGILRCFPSGAHMIFLSQGRPSVTAHLAMLRFAVLVPSLAFGTYLAGAHGAAWAIVATSTVMLFVNWVLVRTALALQRGDQWRVCYRPLLAAVAMSASVLGLHALLPVGETIGLGLLRVAGSGLVGATVYGAVLAAAWVVVGRPDGAERHALGFLADVLPRARRASATRSVSSRGSVPS